MDPERRKLLIAIAGGLGIGGVGVAVLNESRSKPTTETPEAVDVPNADEFGTVVDAVEAGADPDGEEPINGVLEAFAGDDTLLLFPDGTYRLQPITLADYSRFGIAGAAGAKPTFVAEADNCLGGGNSYFDAENVDGFLLESIAFDFTGESTGGTVRITADGDASVINVRASGQCDDQIALFRLDVVDESATAVVQGLRLDNHSPDSWLTGVFVGKQHAGDVIFRNATIQGFTDNGLYASAPGLPDGEGGIVHVEGGTYRNNNVANVRLGSEGSVARGVTSISDAPPPSDGEVTANARGFRLRSGYGQLIEDCTVRITGDSRFTHGGIVFHETNGGATVRDTQVDIDRHDTPAIRLFPRSNDNPETPTFENVEITGSAADGRAVLLSDRDETVFRNCSITQSGENRNGIRFRDSMDCRLIDSTIDVTNHPLVLENSSVRIENTTLITPDGTEEIDERDATDGEFAPEDER
jgi:hypothetical protein